MALRMSQMLRSSKQVRSVRSTAVGAEPAAPVVRVVKEPEPDVVPENLTAAVVQESVVSAGPKVAADSEVYEDLVEIAGQVLAATEAGRAPSEGAVIRILRLSVTKLGEDEGLLADAMRRRDEARDTPHRMAHQAILAMRLGLELNYDERRNLAVGLCALMHDLGMIKVPKEVVESSGKLDDKQLKLLRQHPVDSQRMVESFGPAFAWIGKIVVQVHERQDGSGYPRGLRGGQIHEIARIIGVVDTYLAMAQPRADRPALVTYNALKEIIDLRRSFFDPRLIKALIHVVSIFPLGSLVKLNNGEVGRVIGTSRLHPTRPLVELLLDPRGKHHEPPRHMNLEDEPMLYIVDPAIEEGVVKKK
jgi:HD-GYP domain-containing protein (c-di-GMP phosphodiesterase class II)